MDSQYFKYKAYGRDEKANKIVGGNPEGTRLLGKRRRGGTGAVYGM
jgi:hypothetical protein